MADEQRDGRAVQARSCSRPVQSSARRDRWRHRGGKRLRQVGRRRSGRRPGRAWSCTTAGSTRWTRTNRVVVVGAHRGRPVRRGRQQRARTTGGDARSIDLRGRTVVPGIIDNHNHIVLMGNRPGRHTPLENAYSIADVQQTYARAGRGHPRRRVDHHDRRVPPQPSRPPTESRACRRWPSSTRRCPTTRPTSPRSFSGPSATNSLGKAFFEALRDRGRRRRLDRRRLGAADRQGHARAAPTLLTFDAAQARRPSTRWRTRRASASPRTWTRARSRPTGTPSRRRGARGQLHDAPAVPVGVRATATATVRLRINFLHMETDPALPALTERLQERVPVLRRRHGAHRRHRRVHRPGHRTGPSWRRPAGWPRPAGGPRCTRWAPTDFQTEIQGFETVNAEFRSPTCAGSSPTSRSSPQEYVDRLKAHRRRPVSLTGWRYLAGTRRATARRSG